MHDPGNATENLAEENKQLQEVLKQVEEVSKKKVASEQHHRRLKKHLATEMKDLKSTRLEVLQQQQTTTNIKVCLLLLLAAHCVLQGMHMCMCAEEQCQGISSQGCR